MTTKEESAAGAAAGRVTHPFEKTREGDSQAEEELRSRVRSQLRGLVTLRPAELAPEAGNPLELQMTTRRPSS